MVGLSVHESVLQCFPIGQIGKVAKYVDIAHSERRRHITIVLTPLTDSKSTKAIVDGLECFISRLGPLFTSS